jgi:phosphoribosylformylglycinamidine synthase
MFSLFGAPALSQFRLDQLLRALKAEEPRVQALASRWVHFVDTSRPLTESELEVLGKLLTYGARVPAALREPPSGLRILVTPRVGTESSVA